MAGGVFEDAKVTRTDADHPGGKAFFGIETVVEGVTVNEIDGVESFRFHSVEIQLDDVGKGGGGAGDFHADDFHAQAFAEPFLLLAEPGVVANPELHRAEIVFQVKFHRVAYQGFCNAFGDRDVATLAVARNHGRFAFGVTGVHCAYFDL